jgi:hypothetical protein
MEAATSASNGSGADEEHPMVPGGNVQTLAAYIKGSPSVDHGFSLQTQYHDAQSDRR